MPSGPLMRPLRFLWSSDYSKSPSCVMLISRPRNGLPCKLAIHMILLYACNAPHDIRLNLVLRVPVRLFYAHYPENTIRCKSVRFHALCT